MDFSFERDLALIWLSLFCVVGLLVPIIGLYFAVRGMNSAQKKSLELLKAGQLKAHQAKEQSERLSERTAQPFLRAQSQVARTKSTLKRLTGR